MKKLLAVLLLGISSHAWATGEILSIKTSGTLYCPGRTPINYTPAQSQPLFAQFNGDGTVSIFLGSVKATPDFIADIDGAFIGTSRSAYHIDYLIDSSNYLSVVGRIKHDETGGVKSMTGTHIRVGLLDNCYETGKLTGKRIN